MDLRQFDLNLLVTLDALLATGSVTRAAERLHLSQPAVSSQLKRLRELFNDQLLVPNGRQLIRTARAEALAGPLAEAMANLSHATGAGLAFEPHHDDRTFCIAGTDALHCMVTTALIDIVRADAPHVRLALLPLNTSRVKEDLFARALDLALLTPSVLPEQLSAELLFRDGFSCVGRRDHPLMQGSVHLDDYCAAEHVLVSLVGGGFTGAVDATLQRQGRSRRVVCSIPSFLLVPELLETTDLLATVPTRMAERWRGRLAVTEVPVPMPTFEILAATTPAGLEDPGVSWLMAQLRSLLASGERRE